MFLLVCSSVQPYYLSNPSSPTSLYLTVSPFPKVLEELRSVSNLDYPKSTLSYSCSVFQLLTYIIYSSEVYYFPTSFHLHVLESSPKNQFVKLVPQALSKSSA
nr:MAG TPA: hypothetical protein [Caudoviricetes sp.]